MKNSIVFIFLFFSISTFAQQNKWNIGIIGGPGITALRYKNQLWEVPSPTIGFYTGLSARYNFSEHFALNTELAFDRKGTKDAVTFTDPSGNITGTGKEINQLNYLTLPILFRASIGNKIKYFLETGPYLSYLLNQTYKYSSTIDDSKYNFNTNTTSYRPHMDLGIAAGLGILVPVTENFSVSAELRGNYGFIDLNSSNNSNVKMFNESLNFLVGVNYALGK